jgi:hypothetical protein
MPGNPEQGRHPGRRGERSHIDERARAVLPGFDLLGGINRDRLGWLIDKYASASRGESPNCSTQFRQLRDVGRDASRDG